MRLSDFDFHLPQELIAQEPADRRDHSNLLVIKQPHPPTKTPFYNIIDYLNSGDVMVFNNSKVLKAKLLLEKEGKKIEFYLNKRLPSGNWLGFAKPAKKLKEGDEVSIESHKLIITKKLMLGETEVKFELSGGISFFEFLDRYGHIPLPPYIKRQEEKEEDQHRYQTVYGKVPGSVAAPTAGLHFTENLLKKISDKGVELASVTLHVGSGTFLPVKTENITEHKMHSEYCEIPERSAEIINLARTEGRRVIAVGTTSVRVLEAAAKEGRVKAGDFETNIFITPGFKFQIVDLLLTNFHLPKSTLFMLVCAFAGHEEMMELYKYAISEKMRFFSYGDAMLLTRKGHD